MQQKPVRHEEMLNISGIGHAKLEKFGDEFLEVVLHFTTQSLKIITTSQA